MRRLPAQMVYLPFEAGSFRMAMDLVTVPEAAWFELDQHYGAEMTERRRLLHTAHDQVFAACPMSAAARAEALAMVAAALALHHPDWFSRSGGWLRNRLTDERWDLQAPSIDPLEVAGRLVQEDLCLIQMGEAGPLFTAAVLCAPSRWRLQEKIGRPLAAVHDPVPLYADRLARPVDRFMRHLKIGRIASRLNWSVVDDPALFQPTGKWRADGTPRYQCGECRCASVSAGGAADPATAAGQPGNPVWYPGACVSAGTGYRPTGPGGGPGGGGAGLAARHRALQERTAVPGGPAAMARHASGLILAGSLANVTIRMATFICLRMERAIRVGR